MGKVTTEQIDAASREILGRRADAALVNMYANTESDADLRRIFASSDEAQRRKGFDPSRYGAEKIKWVDRSTLSSEDQGIYDAYTKAYKVSGMSEGALNSYKTGWTPELIKANAAGDVTIRMHEGRRAVLVSKAAYAKYGNSLFTHMFKNEAVFIEKGANSNLEPLTKRWRMNPRGLNEDILSKYEVWVKDPKQHSGIVGGSMKAVGFSKGTANSMDRAVGHFAASPLPGNVVFGDEMAAIGGGSRGAKARNRVLTDTLRSVGLNKKQADNTVSYGDAAGDVVTAIGAGIADTVFFRGAPVASSANQGLEAWEKSQSGEKVDWGKVGEDLAIRWGTYGVAKGLGKAQEAAVAANAPRTASTIQAARYAWQYGGSQAAAEAARGGNREDIMYAAGRGVVSAFLPDDAITQASAQFAMAYMDAKRRGLSDEQAMVQASAAATAATANAAMRSGSAKPLTVKQKIAELRQGWGGKMPDRWVRQYPSVEGSMNRDRASVDRALAQPRKGA